MKIYTEWYRHVEAWRESGLSQADYCRQQGLNPKTLSAWSRRALPIDKSAPLEIIAVQVMPSAPGRCKRVTTACARCRLELSTVVSPRWLAELLLCLA